MRSNGLIVRPFTNPEQRDWAAVDEAIDRLSPRAFGFLEELVRQPSTVGSESGAQSVMAAELERLGFTVERQPIPDDVGDLKGAGVPRAPYGGRHNVIGQRGQGPRSLIINGHIDVVPAETPELWTSPPFEPQVRDGLMYGRGTGDMKCGFAMLSLALGAMREAGLQTGGRLTVVSAIEEECTGNGTLASIDAGLIADAALLVEPTSLDILLGGIGIVWFELLITGRSAHAESADRAVNPIDVAMRLMSSLRGFEAELNANGRDPLLPEAEHPYNLNIGRMDAGDWQSSVPATARIGLRLGFPRAWTVDEAEDRVRQAVAEAARADDWLRDTPPQVRFNGFRAHGHVADEASELVRCLTQAHADAHGTPAVGKLMATTTDARSYLAAGIPAVCYGPVAHNIHGVDEAVELDSIVEGARTLTRFLATWFEGAS
ncbi:MAG TPA: ArgE/DapE family deacylase [Candidatus Limnocylindria bacterium]|nr:ArgE/DapE family deacylase [Candidatus Limnocylindria bacterium]